MPSLTDPTDAAFLDTTAGRLAALPTVRAVTLGGSRAQGTHRPDSDWDMAVHYRGDFDPGDLRALGWAGDNRTLRGELPRPDYPDALRATAPDRGHGAATATLAYARNGHAPKGAFIQVAGAIALATTRTAHAMPAAQGEWVTNEKGIVERAGLGGIDELVAGLTPEPRSLTRSVEHTETLQRVALEGLA
ncbi:nucleotidyltransferase domain-containing protein [Strepomyces sp. STD 3.1]|nr:nucleotidyltransferase domain-containing protein [Streptomyces sp. STD 3.1]